MEKFVDKFVFKCTGNGGLRTSYCCSAVSKFEALTILISMVISPSKEMSRAVYWQVFRNDRLVCTANWNDLCIWACNV